MSYQIVNLLQFYLITMRRTIGPDALLSKTLQESVGFSCLLHRPLTPALSGSTTSPTRPFSTRSMPKGGRSFGSSTSVVASLSTTISLADPATTASRSGPRATHRAPRSLPDPARDHVCLRIDARGR